jgi:hypothetical protein
MQESRYYCTFLLFEYQIVCRIAVQTLCFLSVALIQQQNQHKSEPQLNVE